MSEGEPARGPKGFLIVSSMSDAGRLGDSLSEGSELPSAVLRSIRLRSYGVAQISNLITSGEPSEVRNYLFTPQVATPMLAGSTTRILLPQFRSRPDGIVVPVSTVAIQPTDLMGVYIMVGDYIPDSEFDSPDGINRLVNQLLSLGSAEQRVRTLIALNHMNSSGDADMITKGYLERILPDLAERLRNTLQSQDGTNRFLLSPHGILAALRRTLLGPEPDGDEADVDYLVDSILLVHAVSSLLYEPDTPDTAIPSYAGLPGPVAMELIRNELFYARHYEVSASLSRYFLLWARYGRQIARTRLRAEPKQLLLEATGLELEDWMVCSMAILARTITDDTLWSAIDTYSPAIREQFVNNLSVDLSTARSKLGEHTGEWNFLLFQQYPLLEVAGDVLVVDDRYLLDRLTEGHYWTVADHEKTERSESDWRRWTQAYGEMVEMYVLDIAKRMSPLVLGGGQTVYHEDQLRHVYLGKVCDLVIDTGHTWWCIEIVSGRVTTDTRIKGDLGAFDRDTEKIVLKKARQLDEIISELLRDETALTGRQPPVGGRRVVPMIVNLGTYPVDPMTVRHVDELLTEKTLLQDGRIEPLCIVDIVEMELLEALSTEGGHTPLDVIRAWKQSDLSEMRLLHHLRTQPEYGMVQCGSLYPVRECGDELDSLFTDYLDSVL